MKLLACYVHLLYEKEEIMANNLPESTSDPIILNEDFDLAFKLVFFDENDKELEPAQYKALSTFRVQKDVLRQQ